VARSPRPTSRRHASATLRLLDVGTVPWIASQSVHHAVARVFGDSTPDTLVIVRSDSPYLCVGRHAVGAAVSRHRARRSALPVVRRELGGGTVLITPEQTFFVLVAHRRRLRLPDPSAVAWFLGGGAAAYRRLGVAALVAPPADIRSGDCKLSGSGAATIGEASVIGANVIHDFDAAAFVEVLALPSAATRRLLACETLAQMGSVRHLTGAPATGDRVAAAIRAGVEETWGVRLEPGELSAAERGALPAVERWLQRVPAGAWASGARPPYWKVRGGAGVLRAVVHAPRRAVLLMSVRRGAVAAVRGERGAVRLAAAVQIALAGRGVGQPVEPSAMTAVGVPGPAAAELAAFVERAGRWVS
jgi:lipoate-protein ligase A